jgi:hypothetical protein
MLKTALTLILISIPSLSFSQMMPGPGMWSNGGQLPPAYSSAGPPPPTQTISSVTLSNNTFPSGSGSGVVIGNIGVVMSPTAPAFSGTLTLP